MNGIIPFLVEYFRNLCEQHPDVNGFLTGERYDSNLDYQTYPVVWLRYPILGRMTEDHAFYDIVLGCYTNTLKDDNGNEVVQGESTTQRPANQIDFTSMLPSDSMMERCLRILGNLFVKFKQDSDAALLIPTYIQECRFTTKTRVFNDDVTGAEIIITVKMENPYKCEVEDLFTI